MRIIQRFKIVINYILGAVPFGLFGFTQGILWMYSNGYLCNFSEDTLIFIFILMSLSIIGIVAALHISIKKGLK